MVELRSGTNTGGQEPRTSEGRDPNIPEDIEVTNQGDQMPNQGVQMMDPINQQGQPPQKNLNQQSDAWDTLHWLCQASTISSAAYANSNAPPRIAGQSDSATSAETICS